MNQQPSDWTTKAPIRLWITATCATWEETHAFSSILVFQKKYVKINGVFFLFSFTLMNPEFLPCWVCLYQLCTSRDRDKILKTHPGCIWTVNGIMTEHGERFCVNLNLFGFVGRWAQMNAAGKTSFIH